MKRTYIILIVLIILIILGVGIYYFINKAKNKSEVTAPISSESLTTIPTEHQIANVPYYGEKDFCYGASTMMVLSYLGLNEQEVEEFKKIVKTKGRGGPPDLFMGLETLGLDQAVHLAYSENYNQEWAQFYDNFLSDSQKQTIYFKNKDEALEKLKKLIVQNLPVIALISNGNHYVVVTGYDVEYLYINNPDPDYKQTKLTYDEFFRQWQNYQQDTKEGIGFPGDLGMIWFEGKLEVNKNNNHLQD